MTIQEYTEKWEGANVDRVISSKVITEMVKDIKAIHSHIIQKDIERLEWMKTKLISKLGTHTTFELEDKIEILQTLIDIKRKELEELNNK